MQISPFASDLAAAIPNGLTLSVDPEQWQQVAVTVEGYEACVEFSVYWGGVWARLSWVEQTPPADVIERLGRESITATVTEAGQSSPWQEATMRVEKMLYPPTVAATLILFSGKILKPGTEVTIKIVTPL